MAWVRWNLKVPLVLTPLPWVGSPFIRPGSQSLIQPCLEAHPGTKHLQLHLHLQLSWQPVPVSRFSLISNRNLLELGNINSFGLEPVPLNLSPSFCGLPTGTGRTQLGHLGSFFSQVEQFFQTLLIGEVFHPSNHLGSLPQQVDVLPVLQVESHQSRGRESPA